MEDDVPFQVGDFLGSMLSFRGVQKRYSNNDLAAMKLLGITCGCAAHVHWESENPSQEACILEAQKEVSCCHHGCVKIPRYMDVYGNTMKSTGCLGYIYICI